MGRKEDNQKYYLSNKEKVRIRNQAVRKRNYEYITALKAQTPCTDCGIQYPPYVMDFDHLRDKVCDVGRMASQSLASIKTLQSEIDKCEIVCANCHRIRTFTR
jgi:5-methylcytosine-specific restriction endonuclease McrA